MVYRLEKKHALRCVKRISNADIFEAVISRDEAHTSLVDSGRLSRYCEATASQRTVFRRLSMNRSRSCRPRLGRTLRVFVLVVVIGGLTISATAAPNWPHVRSSSRVLRGLIAEADHASPTFHELIRSIEATDGIVYVEDGLCRHSVRACLVFAVTQSGGFRFLRILIDIHGVSPDADRLELMGTIGHELWHALEVLRESSVTTAAGVYDLYVREAATLNDAFETAAAIAIGNVIRGEVRRAFRTKRNNIADIGW
jgi:hypothetical protein